MKMAQTFASAGAALLLLVGACNDQQLPVQPLRAPAAPLAAVVSSDPGAIPGADQVNDPTASTSYGCGAGGRSLFQGFTPSAGVLSAVELRLRAGGSFPAQGFTTSIQVRAGSPTGSIVGSASATLAYRPASTIELVRFVFGAPLHLTAGSMYVIEWLPPAPAGQPADAVLTWMGRSDDPYPRGTAYGCAGTATALTDFNFKTVSAVTTPIAVVDFPNLVSFSQTVTLDARGSSDPDGGALQFDWTPLSGPQVVLSGANMALASFVAPNEVRTLVFQLRVTDPDGNAATVIAKVTTVASLSQAIFVSSTFGNDGAPGTSAAPVRTIDRAAILASQHVPAAAIYVDHGDYYSTQPITLLDGMSLYGGFVAERESQTGELTWANERASQSLLTPDGPRGAPTTLHGATTAIRMFSVVTPTVVQDMRIISADAAPGQSSIGISVRDATQALVITANEIVAGHGGQGVSGAAGVNGANGAPGAAGMPSAPFVLALGGGGGAGGGGAAYSGGSGGTSPTVVAGFPGVGGNGTRAGDGGLGGIPGSHDGQAGENASNSPHGAGGSGGSGTGLIVAHEWRGMAGAAGIAGQPGSGGGGGGGGNGGQSLGIFGPTPMSGGGGGGGGGGGQGGAAGRGAGGGGGSIGIFLSAASPVIVYTSIATVGGGDGGVGGLGGRGGSGGVGGPGARAADIFGSVEVGLGSGGSGGRGGVGGSGGGGGGGGGGVSCDVMPAEGSTPAYTRSASTALGPVGRGGAGGAGPGTPGQRGADGFGCTGAPAPLEQMPLPVIPRGTITPLMSGTGNA